MTIEEFATIIEAGKEARNIEYKNSGNWGDVAYRIKIIRAILAMSNIRDGGWIVIGMEPQLDGSHLPKGVDASLLVSFREEDMKDQVGEYAIPFVSFDVDTTEYQGNKFILISVREFEDLPVICKKEYLRELRRGAVYVRSRNRRPESIEVSSESDMRELLDLAIDKGGQKLHRRGYAPAIYTSEQDLYEQEAKDLQNE